MKQKLSITITAAALAAALAGCTGKGGTRASQSPDVLQELAVERWQHLIAGEFDQAWEYFTPGYQTVRNKETYAREMRNRPIRWTDVKYVGQECSSDERCEVRIKVTYQMRMPVQNAGIVTSHHTIVETWIKSDSRWGHLPSDIVY